MADWFTANAPSGGGDWFASNAPGKTAAPGMHPPTLPGDLQPDEQEGFLHSIYTAPARGLKSVIPGLEHMAQPGFDAKFSGASRALRGAGMAAAPFMVPEAAIAAPAGTLLGLGVGAGTQALTEGGLSMMGAPPGASALGGDIAGLATGGLAGYGGRDLPLRPKIPALGPVMEWATEHALRLPRGTLGTVREIVNGKPVEATAPSATDYDPRFHGQSSGVDPAARGPVPPVIPYQAPPNVSWTAGTRGAPAQTAGEGAVLNPLGESFVPAGQPLPKPRDIAPVTKVPGPAERFPSDVGRPTVKDEFGNPTMFADNAEADTLPKVGAAEAKPAHTAADAIDKFDVPRKVQNLMRHFQAENKTYEELEALHKQAKASGDWSKIRSLEADAWKTGRAIEAAGGAEKGTLVPGTPYKPPSAGRVTPGYTPQGEGTWERLLQVYPKIPPVGKK